MRGMRKALLPIPAPEALQESITAYKSAGGFAGEMLTGGVAEVGKVSLIGLESGRFHWSSADVCSGHQKFRYYRLPVRNDGKGNRSTGKGFFMLK